MVMGKTSIPVWRLEMVRQNINGTQRFLWKAVDDVGEVLDFCVTDEVNEVAARKVLEKLLEKPWPKAQIHSGASTPRLR